VTYLRNLGALTKLPPGGIDAALRDYL